MNYLELCQRVRQESGISGTGPTTVIGQQGQLGKIIEWVRAAWYEVQNLREDWGFMFTEATFPTLVNRDKYEIDTSDIRLIDQLKIYDLIAGRIDETRLPFKEFKEFRNLFSVGLGSPGRPSFFTQQPDGTLVLAPTPIEIYTITIDYYRAPQRLLTNSDTPYIPEWFHDIIVYKALMMFSAHYEAAMQYQHANAEYERILNDLESTYLPRMGITGPLS